MDVAPTQHVAEPLLARVVTAAGRVEARRILVGAEQHVPPRDVAVVVAVASVLVMNAVHLRALENQADPARRRHVGVIEKFAEGGAKRVHRAGFRRQAEQGLDERAADQRVDGHLDRMLVERSDHLETLRAVVDLMEEAPEHIGLVARAMPPVEDEGRDEVGDQPAERWSDVIRRVQEGRARGSALPAQPCPFEQEAEHEGGEDVRQHGDLLGGGATLGVCRRRGKAIAPSRGGVGARWRSPILRTS